MRIVFMGASELGWECCRTLFEIGQEVVGIFSIPEEFRISWSPQPVRNVRFRNFEDLALRHSIPIIYVTGKMTDDSYYNALSNLKPDLLVVVGWYYMIPRRLRNIAALGAVGIHASLLPKYRGGAPLVWAIINGESRAGVSLFHFSDGVDDGDLIGQIGFPIQAENMIADVVQKSVVASVDLIKQYIPGLADGTAPRLKQDHALATFVPQRKPEDGLIDWDTKSVWQIYNWIRAQSHPYPGAFTYLRGEHITIWKAKISDHFLDEVRKPGEIYLFADTCSVWCADGRLLELEEVGLQDGRAVGGNEFIRSKSLENGMVFEGRSNSLSLQCRTG